MGSGDGPGDSQFVLTHFAWWLIRVGSGLEADMGRGVTRFRERDGACREVG